MNGCTDKWADRQAVSHTHESPKTFPMQRYNLKENASFVCPVCQGDLSKGCQSEFLSPR